jgi:hypothetical protein
VRNIVRVLCVCIVAASWSPAPFAAPGPGSTVRNPFDRLAGSRSDSTPAEPVNATRAVADVDLFFARVTQDECSSNFDCDGPLYCDAYYYCSFPHSMCILSPRTGSGQCVYVAECPACQPFSAAK